MTLSLRDVQVGRSAPTIRHAPAGRHNPQADRAIGIASIAGLELLDWQQQVLTEAMALDAAGRWAAREVALIVGRQNGKGSILEARQVWGLVTGERLQVHSAHQFKTAYEHFRRVRDLVEGCDLLMEQVEIIRTGAGDQAIEFRNGARLRFVARKGGSGRGFSADVVYLDEAFELTDDTVGAMLPTLMARPNAQVWYTSSAPHETSQALHRVRERGIAADDPRLLFLEWGNGNDANVDPLDREAWARANPSMGMLIDVDSIEAAQRSLSPAMFAREHLGVPDRPLGAEAPSIIPGWVELAEPGAVIVSHEAWSIAVSPVDQGAQWASIGKAGRTADGRLCVGWVRHQAGTAWIASACAELFRLKPIPLRVHRSGPEAALIPALREAGVEVIEVSSAEVARATGTLIGAANDGGLVHLGQASLDKSVSGAVLRSMSDGSVVWSQRSSSVEITPLVACTVAAGGVSDAAVVFDGDWFVDLEGFDDEEN